MNSILHNIRILDFSWVLAGPYATRLLADFGAEVIKVQPLLSSETDDELARGYYATWNRNKLGITLNLNKPEGVALAKRLVSISDAVVENFAPRVMTNFGLDYTNLKKMKPDIIMMSMSAMGQKGPRKNYVGFAPTVHALSGLMHLTSFPGKPPLGPGFAYADHIAGLYASIALLGALEQRRRTGEGQHIDISEVDVMRGVLEQDVQKYVEKGTKPEPMGNRSPLAAPHNVYPCQGENRWCAIAVFTEEEWRGFKSTLGNPVWAEDKKFATLKSRKDNEEELDRQITTWTREHTATEVMSLMQQHGVAAGIVQDAADLFKDTHLKARGFFDVSPREERALIDATPIKMSEAGAEYKRSAPSKGQDNNYVYGKLLGMSKGEIEALKEKGVI